MSAHDCGYTSDLDGVQSYHKSRSTSAAQLLEIDCASRWCKGVDCDSRWTSKRLQDRYLSPLVLRKQAHLASCLAIPIFCWHRGSTESLAAHLQLAARFRAFRLQTL